MARHRLNLNEANYLHLYAEVRPKSLCIPRVNTMPHGGQIKSQTLCVVIRFLPSNSAIFGYTMKGKPPNSPLIGSPKQRPACSLGLAFFVYFFFQSIGVRNSLSELCVQHCFKCWGKRWVGSSMLSHTARVSWRSADGFGKQMLGEPYRRVNIGHTRRIRNAFRHDSSNLILSVLA